MGKGAESFQKNMTVMPALRLSNGKPPGEGCYWVALGRPSYFYDHNVYVSRAVAAHEHHATLYDALSRTGYLHPYTCIYSYLYMVRALLSLYLRNRCHRSRFTVSNLQAAIDLLTGTVRCSLEASLFVQISASFVAKNADDPVG